MARRKMAPEEGPHGVDRWTCSGYGMTLNGKKVEPIVEEEEDQAPDGQDLDEIEEV